MIVNKHEHVKPQLDSKPETPTAQLEHNWNVFKWKEVDGQRTAKIILMVPNIWNN